MTSEVALQLLRLSCIPGVGNVTLKKLAGDRAFTLTPDDGLDELLHLKTRRFTSEALELAQERYEDQVNNLRRDQAHVLALPDAHFPPLLRDTPDGPALLFVKGTLPTEKTLSVIGTREPTAHGQETARRLTQHFAQRGWSIVSGLALGIDTVAHRATLEVGGQTVAVLAHGFQMVAPRQNAALAEQILAEGGALVTEYPYGQGPSAGTFVARDRIQAGLSQGVVMVQSDLQGGSRHASRACLKYGRPLALPRPTPKDVASEEPKINANLAVMEQTTAGSQFLDSREWSRVHVLQSKEDYPTFETALLSNNRSQGHQPLLLSPE